MDHVTDDDERRLLQSVERLDAQRRRRSIVLAIVPLVAAGILVVTSARVIARLQIEQQQANADRVAAAAQADALKATVSDAARQLAAAVQAVSAIESLIESKESYLRTLDEARFLIDMRMRFDAVHTALDAIGAAAPELAIARPWRRWVTVIASGTDPGRLGPPASFAACEQPDGRLERFRTPNGLVALAISGDGSFTTAYRETVRLQKAGCAPGAYFADTEKWQHVGDFDGKPPA